MSNNYEANSMEKGTRSLGAYLEAGSRNRQNRGRHNIPTLARSKVFKTDLVEVGNNLRRIKVFGFKLRNKVFESSRVSNPK